MTTPGPYDPQVNVPTPDRPFFPCRAVLPNSYQREVGGALAFLTEYAADLNDDELTEGVETLLEAMYYEGTFSHISLGCLTRLYDAGLTTSLLGLPIPPDRAGYRGFLSVGLESFRAWTNGMYDKERAA